MSHEEGKDQDDRSTAARARESFERAVDALDVGTVNRLRLLRREALSARPRPSFAWLLPTAAAAVVVLALALVWRTPKPAPPPSDPVVAEELTPLDFPSEEEAELYAWLGEAPVATPKGSAL
jgi:hypothetical protein